MRRKDRVPELLLQKEDKKLRLFQGAFDIISREPPTHYSFSRSKYFHILL